MPRLHPTSPVCISIREYDDRHTKLVLSKERKECVEVDSICVQHSHGGFLQAATCDLGQDWQQKCFRDSLHHQDASSEEQFATGGVEITPEFFLDLVLNLDVTDRNGDDRVLRLVHGHD